MEKGEKRRALRRKGIANRSFMSISEKNKDLSLKLLQIKGKLI